MYKLLWALMKLRLGPKTLIIQHGHHPERPFATESQVVCTVDERELVQRCDTAP